MNRLLPELVASITHHPRRRVIEGIDFEWSKKSLTHNIFRAWELIVWRRDGIRCEMTAGSDGTNQWQQPHTFEALCALGETMVRAFFAHRLPKFSIIERPALVTPQGVVFASAYRFAIAFDAAGAGAHDNSGGVTSISWLHTVTGANTLMTLNGSLATGNAITINSFTYNSVTATIAKNVTANGANNVTSAVAVLVAPTTGSNTAVQTNSGTTTGPGSQIGGESVSYTGCKQTGQPDSSGSNATNSGSPTTYTISTTVVAANCWLSGNATENGGDIAGGSPGAGTTYRGSSQFNMQAADSNGTVGTGTQSLNYGRSGVSAALAGTVVSIAPAVAAGPSNVKTFDGVTQSTGVKTYFSVALGSTKSVDGIT